MDKAAVRQHKSAVMAEPQIALVLPYYNEVGFIEQTLGSLAAQTCRDFELILVDNASSDGGADVCAALVRDWQGPRVTFCHEAKPGKIHALTHGIGKVQTELFATLDADTIYPPHYVAKALELFAANPAAAMVMAGDIYGPPDDREQRRRMQGICLLAKLFPAKCHTGAFGQAFRTAAYRSSGGYDLAIWSYVLEDHELIHRVVRHGGQVYARDHYCSPSQRRGDRTSVSWTTPESLLYTLTPQRWMDWYFYSFLGPRFAARGLGNVNLRAQAWQG